MFSSSLLRSLAIGLCEKLLSWSLLPPLFCVRDSQLVTNLPIPPRVLRFDLLASSHTFMRFSSPTTLQAGNASDHSSIFDCGMSYVSPVVPCLLVGRKNTAGSDASAEAPDILVSSSPIPSNPILSVSDGLPDGFSLGLPMGFLRVSLVEPLGLPPRFPFVQLAISEALCSSHPTMVISSSFR